MIFYTIAIGRIVFLVYTLLLLQAKKEREEENKHTRTAINYTAKLHFIKKKASGHTDIKETNEKQKQRDTG